MINVGDRQKGRLRNENVFDVSFEPTKILEVIKQVRELEPYSGENKYVKCGTTDIMIEIISSDAGI